MADPVTAVPEELRAPAHEPPRGALALLRRPDFRRTYLAVLASELGEAFHYVGVMWFALLAGGPLGIVAVRLADSVPALLFGLHGGLVADRRDRKRVLVAADLARAAVLVPVAAAALAGELPLWGLAAAAFLLTTAASYFAPAYGALLPALVDRENVQRANGLVRATVDAAYVGGWALAAALLVFLPLGAFFALTAVSFLVSAALLSRVRVRGSAPADGAAPLEVRGAFAALRPLPVLATAVAVLAVAMTLSEGTWMVGVPELVRENLGRGAGAFSLVMVGWATGSIAAGAVLARVEVERKALWSMLAWGLQCPAYLALAFAGSLPVAFAGALGTGLAHGTAIVLATSAAQTDVPDRALGRVMGLIALVDRGAHATGLIFMGPLFAVFAPGTVFAAAGLALPLVGAAGALVALLATRRGAAARARGVSRTPRS